MAAARAKAEAARVAVEAAINETTDAREREKAAIAENHAREMESLGEARTRARQVASEQHFHRHRDARRPRSGSAASANGTTETSGGVIMKRRPSSGAAGDAAGTPHFPLSGAPDAAHPQTPEEYAAAIDAMRRECERVAMKDENLEERLQLHSEVVGLRRELAVVQEDAKRLRQQLATAEAVVSASDLTVGKDVTIFEEEAQQSMLQKVWVEESECHNPDTMEWADIDVKNLRERVDAARKKFMAAIEKADSLYMKQEAAINETTDAREREKAAIAENHAREMESLGEARTRARQVASEQHFHRHRGTAKAPPAAVPKEKELTTRQRRLGEVEFRTTEQVFKMKDELAELMEQVKTLKRHLDDCRQATEAKRREYEASLRAIEEEGADAREMKERLLKEEEELKELRADLHGVLHYVRAKNREEEGW
ncbi:hypothetical protein LSCM4_01813 [Leishmania orientalis]|uniref:Uncharacterized protein n=1 Tax=Leishmania orientalis TaxID=2249476 RepID=A0A836KKP5_9TRYP|nr:hypothetical protein LSCM4_01813 [Leishmania orientalis]